MPKLENRNRENCSGCFACESICPRNALKLTADEWGFLSPKIDSDKCIDCGLCVRTCGFSSEYKRYGNYDKPIVYGSRKKDINELKASQTGGVSDAIIKCFLSVPGFVFGAAFNDDFSVSHHCVENYSDSFIFRGSKYVQSSLKGVHTKVKELLSNGERVLFIGSPCQVSSLKAFISPIQHTNLYTVDLICHSNTSPSVWMEYLRYLRESNHSEVVRVNFRNKKFGWHTCKETYQLKNGKEIISQSYVDLFFKHLIIRPSCTVCPFTNLKRVGDITIGDFWGWEEYHPQFNDNKGVNLVIVNSEKGRLLFDNLRKDLDVIESSTQECMQPQLSAPILKNSLQKSFFDDFNRKGIKFVLQKYGDRNRVLRMKIKIKKLIDCINSKLQ